ncbi:hypothetical protein [Enhygromyxa salina]|uniref:hypothetical protein n=1 Tax=Enhygromyxa salina TaxID=215803 RepID=UPI0011B1EA3F|nr:hypothetical protein [Enhygromyxa salina]
MARWARALGLGPGSVKSIAYLSGPWYMGLYNVVRGDFDEDRVNAGLIVRLKRGVDTGILSTGHFDQLALNKLVWSIQPSLNGTMIDDTFLHGPTAARLYVNNDSMPAIMAHNIMNAESPRSGVGPTMSKFEMRQLLLGVLGQDIARDPARPGKTTRALSVRDMHDFYKYCVFPVPIEESLQAAGLIDVPVAIEI